tara:strand:- start:201 stop:719 length:519 start_codon:yes stop_codon:yes gene_type:complete
MRRRRTYRKGGRYQNGGEGHQLIRHVTPIEPMSPALSEEQMMKRGEYVPQSQRGPVEPRVDSIAVHDAQKMLMMQQLEFEQRMQLLEYQNHLKMMQLQHEYEMRMNPDYNNRQRNQSNKVIDAIDGTNSKEEVYDMIPNTNARRRYNKYLKHNLHVKKKGGSAGAVGRNGVL